MARKFQELRDKMSSTSRARAEALAAHLSRPRMAETDDLLEQAWSIIANAGGGDWNRETAEWQQAAGRFRAEYHAWLADRRTPPPEDGPVVWVARDDYAELPVRLFHAEPVMRLNGQYRDANGMSGWPVPGSPDAFGLTPGECRAFRLVPVREGVGDA